MCQTDNVADSVRLPDSTFPMRQLLFAGLALSSAMSYGILRYTRGIVFNKCVDGKMRGHNSMHGYTPPEEPPIPVASTA